jgi:hypothetical protein
MSNPQSKTELRAALLRVARELENHDRPESEYDALVHEWDELCPHPGGTDILFWPNELGLCKWDEVGTFEMSAEEKVDYALSWEPRVVAMKITRRTGGKSIGYYSYELEAPDTPKTHITTTLDVVYELGTVVAVALKGVRFPDGSRVEKTFDLGAYSCGRVLGVCDKPVGTVLDILFPL